MYHRNELLASLNKTFFDVVIVGGGINGASLFDLLCHRGYRTLLVDKGDFGCGTSQASSMMIWGGLLYLRNLDILSVFNFSRSRDYMIDEMPDLISPCRFRFLPNEHGLLSKTPILSAMYLYWLIGRFRRNRPFVQANFPAQTHLKHHRESLVFEEGMLRTSDCRFAINMLTQRRHAHNQVAINYCQLNSGEFHQREKLWYLQIQDQLGDKDNEIQARAVVNCAGVWTDRVNESFTIQSPYKHALSKGVMLGTARLPDQEMPLIFPQNENNDVIHSIPWGPVTLWGPTETKVVDIEEGYTVFENDIRFLLAGWQKHLNKKLEKKDIVSLRCGIRPLAVNSDYSGQHYPLDLSRNFRIAVNSNPPWVSVYGGKITGCDLAAESVARKIESLGINPSQQAEQDYNQVSPESTCCPTTKFPGLEKHFPTIQWCMQNEYCCTLEDYLRRRTNISQWVPREGLGNNNEHESHLRELCCILKQGDTEAAERELARYKQKVETRFDRLMEQL